jgi:hypothetical protein
MVTKVGSTIYYMNGEKVRRLKRGFNLGIRPSPWHRNIGAKRIICGRANQAVHQEAMTSGLGQWKVSFVLMPECGYNTNHTFFWMVN